MRAKCFSPSVMMPDVPTASEQSFSASSKVAVTVAPSRM